MTTFIHIDQLDQVADLEIVDEQNRFDRAQTLVRYRDRGFWVTVTRNDEIPTDEPQFSAAISEILSEAETADWDGDDDGHETDEAAFLSAVAAIIDTVDEDDGGTR